MTAEKTSQYSKAHITMYCTADGHRYTPEQWELLQTAQRLEKKLDHLIDLFEVSRS